MDLVPTVDIGDPTAMSLEALNRACEDHGFFLISGHGLDDLIARTWAETERFFAAGSEVKEPLRRSKDQQLGYHDRELTKRLRDHKEVFDFIDPTGPGAGLNRWPDDLGGFEATMAEYFEAFVGADGHDARVDPRHAGAVAGGRGPARLRPGVQLGPPQPLSRRRPGARR